MHRQLDRFAPRLRIAPRWHHQTVAAFEQTYTAMPLENYLWYSGHFMQQAKALYNQLGTGALEQVLQRLVLADVSDIDDGALAQVLAEQPALTPLLTLP